MEQTLFDYVVNGSNLELERVKELTKINPDALKHEHGFIFRWAVTHNYIEIVRFFLTVPECDPSVKSCYALRMATNGFIPEITEDLMNHPKVIDWLENNPGENVWPSHVSNTFLF